MQSALVFLITFLTSTASACADYNTCHCTNADSTANNTATATDSVTKCTVNSTALGYKALRNCKFRIVCTQVGASGPDSYCEDKLQSD
ncbi:hypothetical protein LZ31DRAFT_600723 [Colletotrichum somersetense]|nr:hypothetical protein LZ31DRAFT_600723 [Colletotrichum somersetense]